MKVSFDFDSTLSTKSVKNLASKLIKESFEVWVVTSRVSDEEALKRWKSSGHNSDLYLVTDKLNIPRERIIFTNYNNKIDYLRDKDFIWHLDDDVIELSFFKGENVKGISYYKNKNWLDECLKLIKVE